MKSNNTLPVAAWLSTLMLLAVPCVGQENEGCEVAVAALSLPAGFGGLLHWRAPDAATSPLQLSTRYFSERLKVKGAAIQFFESPVAAGQTEAPPPEPLVSLRIPSGLKLVYIVLWTDLDQNNQARWRGRLFNAAGWDRSSLKVLNSCSEPLGLMAGEKRFQLLPNTSMDFRARDWAEPFPVKIFRKEPGARPLFSSTWRVTAGRRELCFLVERNGRVSLRSLLELPAEPPAEAP